MRKMDALGLKLCGYQAKMFERSLEDCECGSRIFVRRFMNSEFAKRMDRDGFLYESLDVTDALKEIENQYGVSSYGTDKFSAEEMHWIGYIYRYWSYVTEKSSKQIYKMMKAEELKKLYSPYHTLDPMQAIERMTETVDFEKRKEAGDIERGVIVLRKVRRKWERKLQEGSSL
ncbi:MAG: antitoxin [Erysipelotrichaceae bacterium]|nr:antitoxin [Erysipelotrichaceae bacterium]